MSGRAVGAGLVPAHAQVVQADRTGRPSAVLEFDRGGDEPRPDIVLEFETGGDKPRPYVPVYLGVRFSRNAANDSLRSFTARPAWEMARSS